MANSTDFRADQVQTSKIIVTGSNPQKTLLIYGIDADDLLAPNQGNIDPAVFNTSSIGSDVFFFVSGAVGGRGGTDPVIAVIGGDIHVSGNLTVDGTYPSGGGGGTNYFTEIALNSIETTGSVAMTFLSASTGAEITGSLTNGTGGSLVASGVDSHAEGGTTTASGINSHAEGGLTVASGDGSHAEGFAATAANISSHAEGYITFAYGVASHAEGNIATATGDYSHAEGFLTTTYGSGSHAEGYLTVTEGEYSHAEGFATKASGTGSFAAGLGTVASGSIDGVLPPSTTQAAFGKYNIDNNTDSLFVIGDGLDGSNRHDVLRVNSGSVQVTGSLIAPTITGSIQNVDEAGITPFLINGANITVNYNSLGQWEITGSGGGGGTNYFTEIALNSIETTGSVAMTFLSASTGGIITGSLIAPTITGSIQYVDGANTIPFLINGANITTNYNSLGQWEVTGSGGGSAVVTSSLIDFMDKQGYAPSSLGGSYTIGMGFYVAASSSLTNFKVDWHGLSSKTLSIKLWDQAGTVVGAVSQSVSANASVVGAFTSSISLDPYKYYYLSYWEDSGTDYHLYYSLYTGYAAYKFLGPSAQYYRAVRIRSDVIFSDGYLYSSGDTFPTTTNTDTNIAAIEPIL